MNRIDLTPLYRSSVGYDRFGSLLDAAFQTEKSTSGYPPYNIEVVQENNYAIIRQMVYLLNVSIMQLIILKLHMMIVYKMLVSLVKL